MPVSAVIRQSQKLPRELYKLLTWDRGKEITDHRRFSLATDIDVYFSDPHSPWQRGSNENTNGLLRQYFPKPSIAVLPFENMSGDSEQEYFADGITEDLIIALSRIRQFFVIARNTMFTYKGQAVDVQSVASDLGVRYVLEESVRKSGSRVRITTQLIDGDSGRHLWAGHCHINRRQSREFVSAAFQSAAAAVFQTSNASVRNRLNVESFGWCFVV